MQRVVMRIDSFAFPTERGWLAGRACDGGRALRLSVERAVLPGQAAVGSAILAETVDGRIISATLLARPQDRVYVGRIRRLGDAVEFSETGALTYDAEAALRRVVSHLSFGFDRHVGMDFQYAGEEFRSCSVGWQVGAPVMVFHNGPVATAIGRFDNGVQFDTNEFRRMVERAVEEAPVCLRPGFSFHPDLRLLETLAALSGEPIEAVVIQRQAGRDWRYTEAVLLETPQPLITAAEPVPVEPASNLIDLASWRGRTRRNSASPS